jgi:flagellar biosynthetic protein FliR
MTTHIDIGKFLIGHVYGFTLILCRVGAVIMLFPGIAESYVPARMRMALAMSIAFIMMEPLIPRLPTPPQTIGGMAQLVGMEILIGLFFGTFLRVVLSSLEIAGSIIALQTGLSNATIINPTLAAQSPVVSAFLTISGITILFITGLDRYLLQSLVDLYDQFPPGKNLLIGDASNLIVQTINHSFSIGIQLAMPFIVIGMLLFIALGMIQKLMPQVQLFLISAPVQIWGGLTLLLIALGSIVTVWLSYFDASVGAFFGR